MKKDEIKQITDRHIGKLLGSLEGHLTPLLTSQIKRHFRYFEEDIRTVTNTRTETQDESFNK